MARSEPIAALTNGSAVVEAKMTEATPDVPIEVMTPYEEEATIISILDLQPVGGNVETDSSLADSSLTPADGAELVPNSVSSARVNGANGTNGSNGHGTKPTWESLLHLLEAEKARKASSRSRKKEPEQAASTTNPIHLWEMPQEGGEPCSTTLNMTKAEELMPDTTTVSQASLW